MNSERYKQLNVPLLKFFEHLSPEEMYALQKKSLEEYLQQVLKDKAIEAVKETMRKWKANLLRVYRKKK